VKRCTQRNTLTWSTSTPRSASNSSISRYDRPYRSHQRTPTTITSGGNRNPANADRGGNTGRGQLVRIISQACADWPRAIWPILPAVNATEPASELASRITGRWHLEYLSKVGLAECRHWCGGSGRAVVGFLVGAAVACSPAGFIAPA